MDLFQQKGIISSIEMKKESGFGKDGEKNFNGILMELQMQLGNSEAIKNGCFIRNFQC